MPQASSVPVAFADECTTLSGHTQQPPSVIGLLRLAMSALASKSIWGIGWGQSSLHARQLYPSPSGSHSEGRRMSAGQAVLLFSHAVPAMPTGREGSAYLQEPAQATMCMQRCGNGGGKQLIPGSRDHEALFLCAAFPKSYLTSYIVTHCMPLQLST